MKKFTREDSLAFQKVIPMRDPLVVVELPDGDAVLRKSLTPIKLTDHKTGETTEYRASRRYLPIQGDYSC